MAGVATVLANIGTKLGHESAVLQDSNIEYYYHGNYYGNTKYLDGKKLLQIETLNTMEMYDHVVFHDQFDIALAVDDKHIPSSYVFHGNMLRQNPKLAEYVADLESIENIFITTEDLEKYVPNAEPLYRPVDRELFQPMENKFKKPQGLCLSQKRYFPEIKKWVGDFKGGLMLVDRTTSPIPYDQMPYMLSRYSAYFDLKFQPTHPPTLIPEISITALQALACNIPLFAGGMWYNLFPEEHDDEFSFRNFLSVIQE